MDVKASQNLLNLRKNGSIIVSPQVAAEIASAQNSIFTEPIILEQLHSNSNTQLGIRQVLLIIFIIICNNLLTYCYRFCHEYYSKGLI